MARHRGGDRARIGLTGRGKAATNASPAIGLARQPGSGHEQKWCRFLGLTSALSKNRAADARLKAAGYARDHDAL